MISTDTSVCFKYVRYVMIVKNTLLHVFSVRCCLARTNTTTAAMLFQQTSTCRLELLDESTGCYIPCVWSASIASSKAPIMRRCIVFSDLVCWIR